MKITIYELITLIKNKKAPKKIKIDEDILNLEIGKETLYRFEKGCGSLSFGYYINTNKLDNKIEILDKNFKLEDTPKEEKKLPKKLGKIEDNDGYIDQNDVIKIGRKVDEIIDYLESKEKGDE